MSASATRVEPVPRNRGAPSGMTSVTVALASAGIALLALSAVMMVATHPAPAYPWPLLLVAAPLLLVGCLICVRKPGEIIGWLLFGSGLAMSGMIALGEYATYSTFGPGAILPFTGLAAWVSSVLQAGAVFTILVLLVLFPTGTLLSARWRWLGWAVVVGGITAIGVTAFSGPTFNSNLDTLHNPLGIDHPARILIALVAIGNAITFLAIVGAVAQLIVRMIRSRGDEREQLKWFVYVAVVGPLALWVGPALVPPSWSQWFGNATWTIVPIALIASVAVAILKYHLYEIDVVIRRTVVFALLALFITAVYVVVVAGIGAILGGRNPILAFAAAVAVAVAFQPVRDRARRVADRLVYGRRATPYEVLSEFSRRAESDSTPDVLPSMARLLVEASGALRATVWLRVGDWAVPSARWPQNAPQLSPVRAGGGALPALPGGEVVPVVHGTDVLGALVVDASPREPLSPATQKLIRHVAAQAGLVLRNAALIEDVRGSRQRIVSAQDVERRRIERSLREGADRDLVVLREELTKAEATAGEENAPRAAGAVAGLRADTSAALENLRTLARGVYPPALVEGGVAAALKAQATTSAVPVEVVAEGSTRHREEIEAGIYFCALEAIQNALKYAGASGISVRISTSDEALAFEVADDGAGFDPAVTGYGTGLQGIADRLAALGGTVDVGSAPGSGTVVSGTIPVHRDELVST